MANKAVNVNDYDIDAIEKRMEKMSSEMANRLGEPTRPAKITEGKKDKK